MSFFAAGFRLQLKRLLRRPAGLACLLLAPLLTLALCLALPGQAEAQPVLAGVLMPDENAPAAQALWRELEGQNGPSLAFVQAESRTQLEEMVAAGAWECGYLLPQDLDTRIAQGRYQRLFTRVDSPATSLGLVMDWAFSAALLEVCAPAVSLRYMEAAGVAGPDALAALEPALEEAFGGGPLMALELVPVNGRGLAAGADALTGIALVRGVAALLMLLFSCLTAGAFSADLASGFFARLHPYTPPGRLFLPAWAAAMLLCGLSGAASLALLGIFWPGALAAPLMEAACLLLYLLLLAAFSWFLAVLLPSQNAGTILLPFLLAACLLLCPILIDLSGAVPGGRALSALLPPTLYLRAAAGHSAALWQMPLYALCLGLASLGLATLKAKRKVAH